MRVSNDIRAALILGIAVVVFGGAATAPGRQSAENSLHQGRRTTPLYATQKDGTPVTQLTAADLEVLVGGGPVEGFTLAKGASRNKLVFLVFDTVTLTSNLLSKSKKIAENTVSQADGQVRFIVMSIEPGTGLRPVCGPSADKEFVLRMMTKSVVSKQSDYFRSRPTSDTSIRDAYPAWADNTPAKISQEEKRRDQQQDKQVGTIIITSLWTLNAILARFPESDKVVHLHSCGIPEGAALNRSKIIYDATGNTASDQNVDLAAPDGVILDQIKGAGRSIKKSSALLFLINPGGTRAGQDDSTSGEGSLHMLVNESGGRYFEGADKEITRALTATEQGYYEISIPFSQDMSNREVDIEIRSKSPDIILSSTAFLNPVRRFGQLAPQEKQALIVSLLTDGLVGDIDLKISRMSVIIQASGDELLLTAQLPIELAQSEWDIYKVWREPDKAEVAVEKEHILSSGPTLTFGMAPRENTIQNAVLVQTKSGTVLICQAN